MKKITIANRNNATYEVKGNKPLLLELRSLGVDLPYGCQYGGCITCAAKLIKGQVDQKSQEFDFFATVHASPKATK